MRTATALLISRPLIGRRLNLRKADLTFRSQIHTTGNHQQLVGHMQQRRVGQSLVGTMNQKLFPQIRERTTTMTSKNTWILEQSFKHVGPPTENKNPTSFRNSYVALKDNDSHRQEGLTSWTPHFWGDHITHLMCS